MLIENNKKENIDFKFIKYTYILLIICTALMVLINKSIVFVIILISTISAIIKTKEFNYILLTSIPMYSIWVLPDSKKSIFMIVIPIVIICNIFNKTKIKSDKIQQLLFILIFYINIVSLIIILMNNFKLGIVLRSTIVINFILILYIFMRNINLEYKVIVKYYIGTLIFSGIISVFLDNKIGIENVQNVIRITGGLADPNYYVKHLCLAFYILCEFTIFGKRKQNNVKLILIILIIATFSKMGIGLLVIICINEFIKYIRYIKVKKIIKFIFVFLIFIFILKSLGVFDIIYKRIFLEGSTYDNYTFLEKLTSNRVKIWGDSFKYWINNDSNFIFWGVGSGYSSYANAIPLGYGMSLHNSYLQILAEYGMVVLFIYIIFQWVLLRKSKFILKLIIIFPMLSLAEPFAWDCIVIYILIEIISIYNKNTDKVSFKVLNE